MLSRPEPEPEPDPVRPGQESVWDYPRPPRLEPSTRHVRVQLGGLLIADSRRLFRLLETSHPPTYYLHPSDIVPGALSPAAGTTHCEWKGAASYWTVTAGSTSVDGGAWSYESPTGSYTALARFVSFYPSIFECFVDDERVRPQPGNFYGGWITDDIVGPFKGIVGSSWW